MNKWDGVGVGGWHILLKRVISLPKQNHTHKSHQYQGVCHLAPQCSFHIWPIRCDMFWFWRHHHKWRTPTSKHAHWLLDITWCICHWVFTPNVHLLSTDGTNVHTHAHIHTADISLGTPWQLNKIEERYQKYICLSPKKCFNICMVYLMHHLYMFYSHDTVIVMLHNCIASHWDQLIAFLYSFFSGREWAGLSSLGLDD